MRTPTLYLDTSVLGGYFDDEWKEPTRELWRQMEAGQWRFQSSTIAFDELTNAPKNVRELCRETFDPGALVALTSEMEQLATQYIENAVLTPKYTDDARHVAACTVARIDFLADDEAIYVNEVNTIPGSLARYLWIEPPVSFAELLTDMVAEAINQPTALSLSAGADGSVLRSAGSIASKLA